ncbi:hypothetical protein MLD38_002411 [Melastoma candidum]|uniref:Uncharacterized protein n=1 Tax=Melastoma candidum TaxID=119954 RepID=A0ACB9S3M3_9MYRT|nr:hypothetical protein MLD38_002411 [Melastoma candidum]
MKIKNKGKVHPSPSSSSTTTTTTAAAPILATLQLLPATVLALASVLPPPDQEVLSYLLARSLLLSSDAKPSSSSSSAHGSSSFDCGCFDCYTIYWLRWDSSPNRDLIHRVIDAFEDHLSSSSNALVGKGKVRGGRAGGRRAKDRAVHRMDASSQEDGDNGGGADGNVGGIPRGKKGDDQENDVSVAVEVSSPGSPLALPRPASPVSRGVGGGGEHKGLARKVLPDVLGILNSRLWNLWSPNV